MTGTNIGAIRSEVYPFCEGLAATGSSTADALVSPKVTNAVWRQTEPKCGPDVANAPAIRGRGHPPRGQGGPRGSHLGPGVLAGRLGVFTDICCSIGP